MLKKTLSCLLSVLILFSIIYVSPTVTLHAQEIDLGDNNLGFESNFDGWNVNGNVTVQETGGKTGKNALMKSGSSLSKTITGITQGSYTVSMWVKGATSSNSANLSIKDTGGPDSVVKIDTYLDSSTWREIAHRNVLVYNGQMTINVNAGTSNGLYIDEITLTLDSNDNNPLLNWNFEQGLTSWDIKGTVSIDADNADTGINAVKLANQSEVSQIIPVKPNTDYIATVRMKVDDQDTFKTTKQYNLSESSVFGLFVERVSLGNRVNLGVRGIDGVVLRQAPASTEGYALVTIAFHTDADQTEIELYANTIYDQNYLDSVTVYENKHEDHFYPNGWQRPNYEETDNTHAADEWTSNGSQFAYVDNFNVFEISNEYIKGVDMSYLQVIEDVGGKYFANGVQQDALRILSNHGVNSLLTTVWVKAGNPVYDWNTLTPLTTQTLGFDGEVVTGRQVVTGYFDKKHSVAIGKRATELNMTYTPSFHYSDTWISSAKAHMPYEWIEKDYEGKLSNPDINMLETAVYNYVHDTLSEMKTEGIDVISIKHGNEQNGGLLFPVASGSKYTQHAAIITASSRAAKGIYPYAINTIHSNVGYDAALISSFFQAYSNRGAEFDGMAFSLYGGRETTGQFVMMNAALQNNATKYYDYINVETGFGFTRESPIGEPASGMALTKYYNATSNGQYNFLLDYMQAPLDIPNPYGTTRGFYYWNTEAIPVYGAGHKAGETIAGSTRIMFNNGTEGIREMGSSEKGKAGDMMDSMFAFLHRGHTKKASETVYNPLRFNGTNYDVGEATNLSFQNNNLSMKVGEVSRLQPTIAPMDKLLKDYTIRYTSDNASVADVSEHGFVTSLSVGTALITATIGSVSTTVTVAVNDADVASDINITYELIRGRNSVDTGTVSEGNTIQAKPYDKIKFKTNVAGDPTNKAVVYTVSDPEIAWWYGDTWETDDKAMRTLSDKLSTSNYEPIVQLNPTKGGTVHITAASDDGATTVSFNVAVTQTDVTEISINEGDSSIRAGRSLQLTASITPNDASFYKVYWSSDNESIAKVDSTGMVTAINPGTATITIVSDSNVAITDSITLTVTEVLVDELLLSNSKIGLLVGDSKALEYIALPDNAVNKDVIWSVKPGDEHIISVDQNGAVTGLQAGTGTVIVISADGSNVTTECVVAVVNEPITATSMELSESEIWIKSNYFSPDLDGKGESKPVVKLEAVFTPVETINTGVIWSSSNDAVASVDANGNVTAHKPGVADITGESIEGGFTEYATIYVPTISEDWENYDVGSKGGFADGNTFNYEVVEVAGKHKIQSAVKSQKGGENPSTLSRRTFTPVSGDEVVVDFDWNVGSFSPDNRSRGAQISIEDANGNTYLALATYPAVSGNDYEMTYYIKDGSTAMPTRTGDVNGNFNYIHGGGGAGGTYSDTANVGVGLKGANKDYNVKLILDYKARTISFTVTDKNNPSLTSTVSGLAMDSRVNYSNSFGAIAFSHYFNSLASWTTTIDNLAVYNTTVQAEKIYYNVETINMNESEGIKLVPVENALSATAKINASVIPASADQSIMFTPLGELAEAVSIDTNGTIIIKPTSLVNYGEYEVIQGVTGFIRVSSVSAPEVFTDVKLTIGAPNTSEVIQVYVDGVEYYETVMLAADATPKLTYTATGGDGITDIYSYDWQITSGNAQIDANGELSAVTAGNVTVTFTIDFFRKEEVRTLEFIFIENIPTYAVTYDENGGTGTAPEETDKAEDEIFAAAEIHGIIAPKGKRFKEWNTASDGNGTAYAAGATVTMPAESLTLYAIWVDSDDSQEGEASLSGPTEVSVGQELDVMVGLSKLAGSFTLLEVVVNYDSQKFGFATVEHEGKVRLADEAVTASNSDLQILGTAVKPAQGQLYVIVASLGGPITEAGELFTLHGYVLDEATAGDLSISLSDFEVSFEAESTLIDVSNAQLSIGVKLADKAMLTSSIASAQQLYNSTTQGSSSGQYPSWARSAFYAAIEATIVVSNNEHASQGDVDAALEALQEAVTTYQAAVIPSISSDKTELQSAITGAQGKLSRAVVGDKLGQYSQQVIDDLTAAITAAQGVNSSSSASQLQVNEAVAALNGAVQTFTKEMVTLVAGTGKITIHDLSLLIKYYGVTSGDENWNEIKHADVIGEGRIDIVVLAAIAQMILEEWLKE